MPDWATEQMQQSRIPAHLRTQPKQEVGKSGFRGVHADGSRWAARLQYEGKWHHIGSYHTRDEAAYDEAARKHVPKTTGHKRKRPFDFSEGEPQPPRLVTDCDNILMLLNRNRSVY